MIFQFLWHFPLNLGYCWISCHCCTSLSKSCMMNLVCEEYVLVICHLLLKSCVWFFQFVHRGSLGTLHKLWAASSSKVLLIESEGRQTLPRLYQTVQVTEVKGKSFWLSCPAPDTHREAGSQEEACEGPQNSSTCSKSQQWQACLT
jgi:hypothetical protein